MGGESSTSRNGTKHTYYKCHTCNKRISEKKIEKELMKFLNDMLDFFLIIDNTFKSSLTKDTDIEIKRYEKLSEDLNRKIEKIKKAFIDEIVEAEDFSKELSSLKQELEFANNKIKELKQIKENNDFKEDAKLFFNLKEIEKLKLKGEYVKKHNLWSKLSREQKQYIINKYIDEIEMNIDKNKKVSIVNIVFNKNEIENIGYMFRNDCFDMIINVNEQDLILSNFQNEQNRKDYITNLRNFYIIKETNITGEILDISEFNTNDIMQIIPHEKSSKFDKNKFTILQIEV